MLKKISIFGSTGSIGINTLNIIRDNPEKFKIEILVANSNVELIAKQAIEFLPKFSTSLPSVSYKMVMNSLK